MATIQGTSYYNPVSIDYTSFDFSGHSAASLPSSYIEQLKSEHPEQDTIRVYVLLDEDTTKEITSDTRFTFADNNSPIKTVTSKGYKPIKMNRIQRQVKRAKCKNGQAIAVACYSKSLEAMIVKGILYKPECPYN